MRRRPGGTEKLLAEQVAGGIFFTTIQKFAPEKGQETVEEINPRSNIIVICDEAHRTQYGFERVGQERSAPLWPRQVHARCSAECAVPGPDRHADFRERP